MTTIYVIRHGETQFNKKNLLQGQCDIPLNDVGKKQAKELCNKFKDKQVDVILVSPLKRAIQTAENISKEKQIPYIVEEGIIERSFGDIEGKKANNDYKITDLMDFDKNYDKYNIEPIQMLFKRVFSCMENILKKYNNKNILLVTHLGTAQAIECFFNGIPEDKNILALGLENGEVKKYER